MFAVIASVLVASAYAQTCSKPQDMCLKVGANFICPNGMGCMINKANENLSFCCALADINNTPGTPVTEPAPCKDLLNDCPQREYLCDYQNYYEQMTEDCPKTCNRCASQPINVGNGGNTGGNTGIGGGVNVGGGTVGNGGNTEGNTGIGGGVGVGGGNVGTTCVDKLNPNTGVSDCPRSYMYCNHPAYIDMMRDQCPKTCGFC